MKAAEHFRRNRRIGALAAALVGLGSGELTGLAQVSPGGRPSTVPASFPGAGFPRSGPKLPPIFITRPNIPRPGLARTMNPMPPRMDPLPGGGLRRDTSSLYRPAFPVASTRPRVNPLTNRGDFARPAATARGDFARPAARGDFVGPAVGGSIGARNGPAAVGAGSSGFSANFASRGDRWSFAAHLGSGLGHSFANSACLDGLNFCNPCLTGSSAFCGFFPYYPYYPSYYGYVYGESWPVVNYAYDQFSDPALSPRYIPQQTPTPTPPPPPPPTAMELATEFMHVRRYGDAADQLRAHLKADSADYLAMRWLGVAQILAGKVKEGCETVAKAYENDPALGDSILNIQEMGVSQLRVREMCGTVVAYAKRGSAPGAYLTAAMLMQVRDRADLAIKMLTASKEAGLKPELYAELSQSMTK